MNLLLIAAMILALPVIEILLLLKAAAVFGGAAVLAYLILSALAGMVLIRLERQVFKLRMAVVMLGAGSPLKALLATARLRVAGLLFILPGVLSEIAAFLLLVWPFRASPVTFGDAPPTAADPTIIEGEFRREDPPQNRHLR